MAEKKYLQLRVETDTLAYATIKRLADRYEIPAGKVIEAVFNMYGELAVWDRAGFSPNHDVVPESGLPSREMSRTLMRLFREITDVSKATKEWDGALERVSLVEPDLVAVLLAMRESVAIDRSERGRAARIGRSGRSDVQSRLAAEALEDLRKIAAGSDFGHFDQRPGEQNKQADDGSEP